MKQLGWVMKMIQPKSEMKRRTMNRVNRAFNRFIEIEKYESTQDENGIWKKDWVPFLELWAKAKNLHGSEYFIARQVNKQETIKFTVHWMPGLENEMKESMRLLYDGKIYNIDFIDNIDHANEFLEIKAIEKPLKAGG